MNSFNETDEFWVPVQAATQILNVSRSTIHRLMSGGFLVAGVDYMKTTPGKTSKKLYHIPNIREKMKGWAKPSNPGKR